MGFRWLDDKTLQDVWKAAIAVPLSSDTLRAALPNEVAVMLPRGQAPGDQLLKELSYLNGIEALADDSVPLRRWLETAVLMAGPRREAAVFRDALGWFDPGTRDVGDLDRRDFPQKRARPGPIWLVDSVSALWRHPDAMPLINVMKSYPSTKELSDVARQADFDVAHVAFNQALDRVARDLVEGSFNSGHLKAIILAMRNDSRIRRCHEDLQAILDRR
ncbi:MAG: hypothetical protein QM820_45495 [Minicystis sp.]